MQRFGFIGLGNMGGSMAKNLLKSGKQLVVFDVNQPALAELKEAGASVAKTPKEVAQMTDGAVITMLPANDHVSEVYTSENGLLAGAKPGTLFIDCSTVDPKLSKELACRSAGAKADFADAPVSGGVNAARDGILTFMVGCDERSFEKVKGVLEMMGKTVHYCGVHGTGEAAKLCNNMLLGISMIGVSETMNLGVNMGLDPKKLATILNTSTGRCWSSDTYNPVPGILPGVPASNEYKGGFGCALMCKDLGLAINSSVATNSPTPLGSLAAQIYRVLSQKGYGHLDFGAIYKFLSTGDGIKK